ncbi:MAG TPA: LD-carboxypeptidase, partial [Vicinamibacterales bacterium]|nr:LD-carboxypeptidase [Vicinamibacterales bacterium]
MNRRTFLLASTAPLLMGETRASRSMAAEADRGPALSDQAQTTLKPARLQPGDTIGLVAPASATFQEVELDIARESIEGLGLKVKVGAHIMDRHGSLGGQDKDRAADINRFFADSSVKAVLPTRGGWGTSRLLPLLDYETIRRNPKILMGYSDITALLNGIHARTGLITFHGPNAGGRWDEYSLDLVKRVLFDGAAVTFDNPKTSSDRNVLTQVDNRIRTITPGKATGRLLGGNLSVLTAILGSPYVPNFEGAILFLEDVDEDWYRVDRMMTSLKLAGILGKVRGVIFGTCSECGPGEGFASLTPEEIFADHLAPLGVPCWQGAMIGPA